VNTQEFVRPENTSAERSILGAVLLEPKTYDECVSAGLAAEDFGSDAHRKIFRTIQKLAESAQPIDIVTVPEHLQARHELDSVGGYEFVSSLLDGVPDRPSVIHYVRMVREAANRRRLVAACDVTVGAISDNTPFDEAASALQESVLQIQTGSEDAPSQRVVSFTDQVFREWEEIANGTHDVGLTTSLDCLDLTTGGIRRGDLIYVGGYTGSGKTALALQIAAANCRRDISVAMFSIEMARGDLLHRLWSQEGRIPFHRIRYPRHLDQDTRKRIERAMCAVGHWPLFIVEDASVSLQKLVAKSRLLIRQEKIQLIIVDYAQLISAAPVSDERQRLTRISNTLRVLAKDTGTPVLAISQLSRPRDGNPNIRPNKFSLKESGSQENDAHVILLTYRPVDEFGLCTGKDEIIVAKQRSGPVGNERVYFDANTLTFHERTERSEQ